MILAAHQPNYMPWIGYFHKMDQADKFVLADDVQYTTQSYTNRTHIKTPQGKQWLTVPVLTSGKGCQLIKDVRIDRSRNWRQKHHRAIYVNYKSSPHFDCYFDFFDSLFQQEWEFLLDLNLAVIDFLRNQLAIETPIHRSSGLQCQLVSSTERIVKMVKDMGCNQYISGRGGSLQYLNDSLFQEAGIDLMFDNFDHPVYPQQFGEFIPNLSAIDLLFNTGEEARNIFCSSRDFVSIPGNYNI